MDQIVDTDIARGLQDGAARTHGLIGWVISQNPPEHPGKALMARLITKPVEIRPRLTAAQRSLERRWSVTR